MGAMNFLSLRIRMFVGKTESKKKKKNEVVSYTWDGLHIQLHQFNITYVGIDLANFC